ADEAISCGALRLCAVCDAYEARDGRIAILGPAAALAGHARFLRGYTSRLAAIPTDRDLDPAAADELRALDVQVVPQGGELKVDSHQQAGRPGLYAVGDVVSGLNQISVAVGQAAVAATHAHNSLPFVPRA